MQLMSLLSVKLGKGGVDTLWSRTEQQKEDQSIAMLKHRLVMQWSRMIEGNW